TDTPAVQAAPEHRRDDDEAGEQIPGQAVGEGRQAQIGQPKHVADREQAALDEPEVGHGGGQRRVFQANAFSEEADQGQRQEGGQQHQIERLRREDLAPALAGVHYFSASGGSSAFATMRELSRMARAALLMLIDARATASTSPPTLKGSLMLLPLNCVANFG